MEPNKNTSEELQTNPSVGTEPVQSMPEPTVFVPSNSAPSNPAQPLSGVDAPTTPPSQPPIAPIAEITPQITPEPMLVAPVNEASVSTPMPLPTAPQDFAAQSAAPGLVVSAGSDPTPPPTSLSKKKLLLIGGSVFAVLALVSGAVFGLYLPNTPDRVWNTGINRTGEALNSIVETATEPKKLETYKTSEIAGTINAKLQDTTYTGDFTTTFDQKSLDGGLNFTLKDTENGSKTIKANVLSELPAGKTFPDVYFKLSGLKTLGLDEYMPSLSAYDSKWILASSSYLESIGADYLSGGDNNTKQITSADIAEVARVESNVTKEYLLSTNEDKAVFVKQSFVGKEAVDGLKTYHYKVGVNLEHAKAYCTALGNALYATNAYKKITGSTTAEIAEAKKAATKSCQTSVDESLKASDTFDMWIDGKYKLVYKLRVYDETDKGMYTDVGQIYKGGDDLSLFVAYHDTKNKTDGKFTLDTNIKTNATKGTFTYISTNSDYPYSVKVTLTAKSLSKAVKITKPTNAVPIQDVLKALGYDTESGSSNTMSISKKAADTERRTDINALMAYLDQYWASNTGHYPTLAEINNSSWRSTHMPDLDEEALKNPGSSVSTLTSTASATQYGYTPTGCTSAGCINFTISALLSDGTTYTKTSASTETF